MIDPAHQDHCNANYGPEDIPAMTPTETLREAAQAVVKVWQDAPYGVSFGTFMGSALAKLDAALSQPTQAIKEREHKPFVIEDDLSSIDAQAAPSRPVTAGASESAGLREAAHKCALYDFDGVEMVECKWALWQDIVNALPSASAARDSSEVVPAQTIEPEPDAGGADRPVAWIIGLDNNANDKGFIDAMAWQEGEFSTPLYARPASTVSPQDSATPVAWRYQRKVGWDGIWRYYSTPITEQDFETPSDWVIQPLYATTPAHGAAGDLDYKARNFLGWLIEDTCCVNAEVGTPRDAQLKEFQTGGFLRLSGTFADTNSYEITGKYTSALPRADRGAGT